METGSQAAFTLEEVIGPDGRYVLYYRWPDEDDSPRAEADDAEAEDGPAARVKPPQPDV